MTDPTELRRLAEAATPGPWMVSGGWVVSSRANIADCSWAWDRVADQPHMVADDLRYIAAMHPQTTLALLDRLARAETLAADARRFRWVASLDHGGTREIRLSGVKRNGDAWSHGISWDRTSHHADIRAAIDAEMKERGDG